LSRGPAEGSAGRLVVRWRKKRRPSSLAARSIPELKKTAEQVIQAGGHAEIVVTELTEEESIKDLVRVTGEKFGRLDILVNNRRNHSFGEIRGNHDTGLGALPLGQCAGSIYTVSRSPKIVTKIESGLYYQYRVRRGR